MAHAEVLGIGCTAVDDLVYVERNPGPDGKEPVARRDRAFGGLIGTALVAAAKLGCRAGYAGRLGTDEHSSLVAENFARHGVETALAPRGSGWRVVHSTIVVAAIPPSRCILFDCKGEIGPHPELPPEDAIAGARVLMLDHYGLAGGLRAARLARKHGVAVIADIEGAWGQLEALLAEVDHLILSRDSAERISGKRAPEDMVASLWRPSCALVAITDGERGCWWSDDGAVRHLKAFAVQAVDTTGCGDVFHGAYAAAIVRGLPTEARLRYAAAAAALKATRSGGQSACPTAAEVDTFLSTQQQDDRARHAQRSR